MTMLSVTGLYHYDPTIFDGLQLPDGLDRDAVLADILLECAELEVLLPDPDTFKESITYWSRSQLPIWQKLYDTTTLDYNPIWNKDGTYTETETRDLASAAQSEAIGKVTGYNSSTMQPADQQNVSGSGTDTGTITRERRETGNIGVTTTQQMIKEEREVSQFNIYRYITESFKSMYCLGVY